MAPCDSCRVERAAVRRPKTGRPICQRCFFAAVEDEVHATICTHKLFRRGEHVAVAASGGKDSTVLAHLMRLLNDRHDYGLDLCLLSVDEGIAGYRDDSLGAVRRHAVQTGLPLRVVDYEQLYGWTMDAIVKEIGRKNNCTFCGVFRRQALDRGALLQGVDHIVTGHNADDVAETVLMNCIYHSLLLFSIGTPIITNTRNKLVLRGDIARLQRCTDIVSGGGGGNCIDASDDTVIAVKRSKPLKYTYEKEIVMYAYFKRLDYFSTECIYSPQAYRGHARAFLKDLEAVRPSAILDIVCSGEAYAAHQHQQNNDNNQRKQQVMGRCKRCGYMSSQRICKACVLLEGLNRGLPQLGVGKTEKLRRIHGLIEIECEQSTTKLLQPINELKITSQLHNQIKPTRISLDF